MKNTIRNFTLSIFAGLACAVGVFAQPTFTEFKAAGADPNALLTTINDFRAAIGGANNGAGGSFKTGRREINWDGAPDTISAPNAMPANQFLGRGVIFANLKASSGSLGAARFSLSADSNNPTTTAARFGNINPQYTNIFKTFSAERLFIADGSNVLDVSFFIPGTSIPATVSSFGVVFTDVDYAGGTNIEIYGTDGALLRTLEADPWNEGLSFAGVVVSGARIARVVIKSGNLAPGAANDDDNAASATQDVVAMDDFIYGEPRARERHTADFDGDGTSDFAVFRPSSGHWFILNSGSNTFTAIQFGANEDVPVEGDFDGDKLSDIAVFRPSSGTWFRLNSSNGQFVATQFGAWGDKPIAADYDKDGVTDIAVWRPSSGNYFFLRSSNGAFSATQFGTGGDIPLGAAIVP